MSDGDETVVIWTAQRSVITRLRNHGAFAEIGSGRHGATAWAEFTIPAANWSPLGVKRQSPPLSDAERERRAARLREVRP